MQSLIFWITVLSVYALLSISVRYISRGNIMNMSIQLLMAGLLLPCIYNLFKYIPDFSHLHSVKPLISDSWFKEFYLINFILILGFIIADIADCKLESKSIKIALPSFSLPMIAGFITGYCYFHNLKQGIAMGLIFSITAVPVLYLYLKELNWPINRMQTLMQSAIIMDIFAWSIFSCLQGTTHPVKLMIVIGLGLTPLITTKIIKHSHSYSYLHTIIYFALLLLLENLHYNSMLFAMMFILTLRFCKQHINLNFKKSGFFIHYQNYICIPLIISYGMIQIDYSHLSANLFWFGIFLLIPLVSKTLGNAIGLKWQQSSHETILMSSWKENILLGTRGLTEIVFLNIMLNEQLINPEVYLYLMIMSLLATLLPGIIKKEIKSSS
jgi:hypothetical protein